MKEVFKNKPYYVCDDGFVFLKIGHDVAKKIVRDMQVYILYEDGTQSMIDENMYEVEDDSILGIEVGFIDEFIKMRDDIWPCD